VKIYNVGIYARLSRENKGGDSVSIENQVSMLTRFTAMMPDWIKTRTYIDDGASGTNFQRRGFTDMMEDVRNGVINLVLVKDLSRFGRNYLETGRYLEDELPNLGCRFVAIDDNIDSETGETDIMSLMNAINDFFVRDTSKRIKSVMSAKAKDGQKLSGVVPYGYDRNPNARTRLIVDEYAAAAVKKVFKLRSEGMGYNAIAGVLNKEGITPPRRYYFERRAAGRSRPAEGDVCEANVLRGRSTKADCAIAWTIRTVKLMLNNEIYLGHTVSMNRVENTHQPLVDLKTWDKVQRLNQTAKKNAANHQKPQKSLFSGLLICSDCNAKMGYAKNAYVCRTYTRSGCAVCSSHRINEGTLKALVISDIRKTADKVTCDESAIRESLKGILRNERKAKKAKTAQEKRFLERQLLGYDNQITKLYEERAEGLVTLEDFYACVCEAETQREVLEKRYSALRDAESETRISRIKEKPVIGERDLLESLIDRIEVGERQAGAIQDIRIFYKF
jgi:DNA invertase Pin-like site-specific DNA recombinase